MNKRDKMKLNTANKSKVSQKAATHRRTKTQNKKKNIPKKKNENASNWFFPFVRTEAPKKNHFHLEFVARNLYGTRKEESMLLLLLRLLFCWWYLYRIDALARWGRNEQFNEKWKYPQNLANRQEQIFHAESEKRWKETQQLKRLFPIDRRQR